MQLRALIGQGARGAIGKEFRRDPRIKKGVEKARVGAGGGIQAKGWAVRMKKGNNRKPR